MKIFTNVQLSSSTYTKENDNDHFHFILAILFTFYLFYLDEGYFNFNWMKSIGNWFMFAIYAIAFTTFQLGIKFILSKVYRGKYLIHLVLIVFLALVYALIFYAFKS